MKDERSASHTLRDPNLIRKKEKWRQKVKKVVRPVMPSETVGKDDEEYQILYFLYRNSCAYGYWKMINELSLRAGRYWADRQTDQRFWMALMQRMINEGKFHRVKRRGEIQLTVLGEERIMVLSCVNPINKPVSYQSLRPLT